MQHILFGKTWDVSKMVKEDSGMLGWIISEAK